MLVSGISVGAVTPVGLTAPSTAAAIRAGVAGFAAHPFMVDSRGEEMIVASVPRVAEPANQVERLVDMAMRAAKEALNPARKLSFSPRIVLALGFPEERPGIPEMLGSDVTRRLTEALANDFEVVSTSVNTVGHAAGLVAIETCCRSMQERGCNFGLVGAVDSYVDPETLEWLESREQLHNSSNPWGFVPGEGAGFCLLATEAGLAEITQNAILDVRNVSLATESNVITSDAVCTGQGLTSAIERALDALPDGTQADDIICDLNGEPYRADEYSFVIPRVTERCRDAVDFQNPADCWGDIGAASGVLFLMLTAAAGEKSYANGPHTLVCTSSEGGVRAAALFSVPHKRP